MRGRGCITGKVRATSVDGKSEEVSNKQTYVYWALAAFKKGWITQE